MFLIKDFSRQFVAEWNEDTALSIVCISTTNPVYLIFSDHLSYPELVMRIVNSEDAYKAHDVTKVLYKVVGDLIPEPVAIAELNGKDFAIQRGVKGVPWFQLSQKITTPEQWSNIRNRAITALAELHNGIRSVESWHAECAPGQELRNCYKKCTATGLEISDMLNSQVDLMSCQLDTMGMISVYPQHGDYCLNNLIIDDNKMHVIDFEDFGMTTMPLHDEFSLALSTYSQSPRNITTSLLNELDVCSNLGAKDFGIDSAMRPAFFMHHLLLRLGGWSHPERRGEYRRWLISILDDFISDPHLFFNQSLG